MKKLTQTLRPDGMHFALNGRPVGTACARAGAKDRFISMMDGVVLWERTVDAPMEEMEMRFVTDYAPVYTMIPAIQYDGNRCMIKDYETVRAQKLQGKDAQLDIPSYYAGDRYAPTGQPYIIPYKAIAIPGATYSEGSEVAFAMFFPTDCMFGAVSLYEEEGEMHHVSMWPEQSAPVPKVAERQRVNSYRTKGKEMTCFKTIMVFSAVERPRTAWRDLLDTAWALNYTLWAPDRTQEDLWDLGVSYAKTLYTEEPDGFCGFSIGMQWEQGAWRKRSGQKYEIGWCGQNASLAVSLLVHAQYHGDEEAKRMGLNVLDSWVRATKSTGLIPTHYDDNMYTNGYEKTIDACNLGTAAVQLWQGEEWAAMLGESRPEYARAADAIREFALRVMDENGRIGKSWLEKDLTPAVQEGTTGAFLTWALCEYARRTGRGDVLEACERSMRYYARTLTENGYTTAGALDIFTIDKESCMPLLKSALALYELTGKDEYLRHAVDAAYYLSTWQWHYNRPVRPGSLYDAMKFKLFGGTAVSIHGDMDPYALFYVNDLLKLSEITGDVRWTERAAAAWRHGQQCISDGDYVLDGKAPRPRGAQDESSATGGFGWFDDAPSQWLVAWPTAFRLEVMRKWLDESGRHFTRVL